jgi:nucleotide-binding universal stress UspA family protein
LQLAYDANAQLQPLFVVDVPVIAYDVPSYDPSYIRDALLEEGTHVRRFAESVLIAWDGSRESARALADALPVIKYAKFVTIVTVEPGPTHGEPAGIDVAAWLERHNIQAGFATVPRVPGVSAGSLLLTMLTDRHIDLVVTGAYGHARVQERLLGGVTRTMLQSMTVPVLMSH